MTTTKPHASLIILSAQMAVTSMSVDIYLPAMPLMEKEIGGNVELTITGFLVGFALAQLFWGPVSDRIGRKMPLFIGMAIFTIGSIGCALSGDMHQIMFWRVFQAFGACTAPMLSRAMVRDIYSEQEAARMLSTLIIMMALAPILGLLICGQLLKLGSWHYHFIFLAIIGFILFVSIFRLPESLPVEKRIKRNPVHHLF